MSLNVKVGSSPFWLKPIICDDLDLRSDLIKLFSFPVAHCFPEAVSGTKMELLYGAEWLTQPECAPHESSAYTNKVWLAAYAAETALKMFAVRALYWTNGFKILDIVLVGISIVGQLCQTVPGMQFLRIVRVARIRKADVIFGVAFTLEIITKLVALRAGFA